MSDITNPHDAFFKQFMTKPEIAADFLTQHLPANVLALLDLSTLVEQKESFIDPDLRQHFSDVLYQVKNKWGKPLYMGLAQAKKRFGKLSWHYSPRKEQC